MRVPPKVKITFFSEGYQVKLVNIKNNVIKFKVTNEHGHIVKKEIPIKGIELSAEL